ncbi:hypothetical protein AAFF_G00104390 [Aldrovandia affinis]|uniref:Parathyroid hormone n=1 Tax=Aldrovandia affinis TaxID=143900 RepID=A0AAD7WXI8_9TELE|nr:hypothetical protein AAFF_G00104390 [Aldrovandia affinis]
MFSIRHVDTFTVTIFLCILCYSMKSDGKPLGKRSVSEVQLMHDLGEHKHVQKRQDWLQLKMKDIHTASLRNSERGERVRARRLLPEDFPGLDELTPTEVEYILNYLENHTR